MSSPALAASGGIRVPIGHISSFIMQCHVGYIYEEKCYESITATLCHSGEVDATMGETLTGDRLV